MKRRNWLNSVAFAAQASLLASFLTGGWTSAYAADQATEYVDLTSQGHFAHLYVPSGAGPFPTIIAVGGSEGAFITGDAFGKLLVKEGFAVLGLAYFGTPGRPPKIDRIPLEQFVDAVNYVASNPALDASRIGIVGGSKGGELVLLLAAREPKLRAVCAIVPSSVVWQSARLANSPTSSWTINGQQLPFVPYKGPIMPASQRIADLFEDSLLQERAVQAAIIPVENINGPVLLISAARDEIWPSGKMSAAIMARLDEKRFAYAHKHLNYDTGHGFSPEVVPEINAAIAQFFHDELTSRTP